ncbi:MAG TPA: pirin-like C-terminal cupin domain-containing protein, partial [Polyangiales bacterium]|nr:pirin-like C-terminal cupin domain-containing protein [Polyangiales bacterium]
RAFYVVSGRVRCESDEYEARSLVIARPGAPIAFDALETSRVMLLGGQHLGERHIEWNFVSSRQERIELAKDDWRARRFPIVPSDPIEFIPLP